MKDLFMEHNHPLTLLSIDSSNSSFEDLDLEINNRVNHQEDTLVHPPDINLPLAVGDGFPLQPWNSDSHDNILDVGLSSQICETKTFLSVAHNKVAKKVSKRVDSIWGAWFFFSFYFRPALNEKSKAKIVCDSNGVSGFDKSDLQLDTFLVQHDMENIYMWVFKERPENALGKMQLRSYMNGHSRQGERPFPFCVEKGFARSHRMQRKQYRGLSNPQCVHGLELVPSPSFKCLNEDEMKRWIELTGRNLNFIIPPEASDFGSWRNLPIVDFELERPLPPLKNAASHSNSHVKKLLNARSGLNLSNQMSDSEREAKELLPKSSKRRKDMMFINGSFNGDCNLSVDIEGKETLHWLNEFSGVMKNAYGPVTAAKSIYEDETGFLIVVTLPFVDLNSVKVSWRNTLNCGIIKVCCMSTGRMPLVKRRDRTFKLADPKAEHCPPGEFMREIQLSTRIPEGANIEAYFDGSGSVLEILVPKLCVGAEEEHEVRVCLRPGNDLMLA